MLDLSANSSFLFQSVYEHQDADRLCDAPSVF